MRAGGSGVEAGSILHSLWLLFLGRRVKGRKPYSTCTQNISSNRSLIPARVKKPILQLLWQIHRALTEGILRAGNLGYPFLWYKIKSSRERQEVAFQGGAFLFGCWGVTQSCWWCCWWHTKHATSAALQCKAQTELLTQLCSGVTAINPWSLSCVSPSGLNTAQEYLTIACSYHSMAAYLVD